MKIPQMKEIQFVMLIYHDGVASANSNCWSAINVENISQRKDKSEGIKEKRR